MKTMQPQCNFERDLNKIEPANAEYMTILRDVCQQSPQSAEKIDTTQNVWSISCEDAIWRVRFFSARRIEKAIRKMRKLFFDAVSIRKRKTHNLKIHKKLQRDISRPVSPALFWLTAFLPPWSPVFYILTRKSYAKIRELPLSANTPWAWADGNDPAGRGKKYLNELSKKVLCKRSAPDNGNLTVCVQRIQRMRVKIPRSKKK